MIQKTVVFLIQIEPDHRLSKEALDALLVISTLDQVVQVILVEEGLLQCVKSEALNNQAHTWSALPLYGIKSVYVCEQSLQARKLTPAEFSLPITLCSEQHIRDMIHQSNQVFIYSSCCIE